MNGRNIEEDKLESLMLSCQNVRVDILSPVSWTCNTLLCWLAVACRCRARRSHRQGWRISRPCVSGGSGCESRGHGSCPSKGLRVRLSSQRCACQREHQLLTAWWEKVGLDIDIRIEIFGQLLQVSHFRSLVVMKETKMALEKICLVFEASWQTIKVPYQQKS